jgi:predicted molibdopterin-dependent oxidoreductase YjgC
MFGCLPAQSECGLQIYRKKKRTDLEERFTEKSKKMKITMDGKQLEIEGHKTLLEAARENNIDIPSLCDHPRLSPFSGCRLCLVEIKGRKGFAPSCSTYPEDGMEVTTNSARLQKMRKQILGLILSEHPNACLVCSEKEYCDEYKSTIRKVGEATGCVLCPNNGRCELQDVVEAVNLEKVDFASEYRNFEIRKDDPFFDRNYNLCILCGRCVRVCQDIRGASTLSFVFRGSDAVVGTVLDRSLLQAGCQFCGACLDVCPTGALTERAVRYESLPDSSATTFCPLCSIGCELEVKLIDGRISSTQPSREGTVNKGQACVKGRFVIRDTVYSSRRILWPMIRRKKELEMVSWDEALDFVAQKLKTYKGKETAVFVSPQIFCEDIYLVNKFAREGLRTRNIGVPPKMSSLAELWDLARKSGMETKFNFQIGDISDNDVIFLAGTDLVETYPIIWLEVLEAVKNGAELIVASPVEPKCLRHAAEWLPYKPGSEDFLFNSISKVMMETRKDQGRGRFQGFEAFRRFIKSFDLSKAVKITGIDKEALSRTAELLTKGNTCFISGKGMMQYSWASQNLAALWNLSLFSDGQLFPLVLTNNDRGVWEIFRSSAPKPNSLKRILQGIKDGEIKAVYLAGPGHDGKIIKPEFMVVQDSFMSELAEKADAVFPSATFAESEGIFVNTEGRQQKVNRVIDPVGGARPDWLIFSQLAKKMNKKGFDHKKPSAIFMAMRKEIPAFAKTSYPRLEKGNPCFVHEGRQAEKRFLPSKLREPSAAASKRYPFILWTNDHPDFYRNLDLTREVKGLGIIRHSRWFKLNPVDAEKLGLKEKDNIEVIGSEGKLQGVAKITESVSRGVIISNGQHPFPCIPVKIKRGS